MRGQVFLSPALYPFVIPAQRTEVQASALPYGAAGGS